MLDKKFTVGNSIFLVIALIYFILIFIHVFFPKSKANEFLSTRLLLAQYFAFPILFGSFMVIIALLIVISFLINVSFRKTISLIWLISWLLILVSSLFLAIFGNKARLKKQLLPRADFSLASVTLSNVKADSQNPHNQSQKARKVIKQSDFSNFKIVEYNALNILTKEDVAEIFLDFAADIAVFPELAGFEQSTNVKPRLNDLFKANNINIDAYQVFVSSGLNNLYSPVTVVTKKSFALYKQLEISELRPETYSGTVYLQALTPDRPDIVGIHTAAPVPHLMTNWRQDLETITYKISPTQKQAILIGDFNAVLTHGALSNLDTHTDALQFAHKYKRGTWPSSILPGLCSGIDHIFLPNNSYEVLNTEIKKLSGSDHLAIFAELKA